jgi:hypothetical protein
MKKIITLEKTNNKIEIIWPFPIDLIIFMIESTSSAVKYYSLFPKTYKLRYSLLIVNPSK